MARSPALAATTVGTRGADVLIGSGGYDTLVGLKGDDQLCGSSTFPSDPGALSK